MQRSTQSIVQSLNSLPAPYRAQPRRAKEESRITCMRMLRTTPFFPPKSGGKTIFGSTFQIWLVDFPFKNFCKIGQQNVWEKSNDAYSLSIRVQSTINHISIFTFLCFLRQYQRQRKCFLSERELKKALRDTLTRAAWLGPGNFLLVRSEHAHASYPGLFFRPPGLSPYMGREERRVQGLDYTKQNLSIYR